MRLPAALAAGALAAASLWMARAALAQHPGDSARGPLSYLAAQASAGGETYQRACSGCHGATLNGGGGPPLTGPAFQRKWGGQSADQLFAAISRMPPGAEASLTDGQRAELLALILKTNGAPAGNTAVPTSPAVLAHRTLGPTGGGARAVTYIPPPAHASALDRYRPVAAGGLVTPPAEDWPSWRRTYDGAGYSPLTQIDRRNVGKLQVAWSWSLPPGGNMMAPIVHDGVLFAYSYGDVVEALDAATGELLWRWQHPLSGVTAQGKKGVAISGGLVFVPTSDMHVFALDARTGKVVWDHAIDAGAEKGHQIKTAPLVAGGKVVIGVNGFQEVKGGNFIVALDAATGDEAWRFHTVARPGETGGDSWNGLAAEKRSGASVWVGGSYDPVSNRVFYGTGQTYDTVPLRRRPGETRDNSALFTDSTVALDATTGKLAWWFQHQPNDQLDHDWAFERLLLPLKVDGRDRQVVATAGKDAIFDVLDGADGRYQFSLDLGMQNVVASIDSKTGEKHLNPAAVPTGDKIPARYTPDGVCPDLLGARNLMAGAYSLMTRLVYLPLTDTCVHPYPNGTRWEKSPDPKIDGTYGVLDAINLQGRHIAWKTRVPGPFVSAALATAGDVIFAGTADRRFLAFDARTGKVLWDAGLDNAPASFPVSYAAAGRQFVAVATNEGFVQVQAMDQVAKIRPPPAAGATLWVFALPRAR